MSRAANTWSCARCGTAAFADQNFCRRCGARRDSRRPAPITTQVPIVHAGATTGVDPDVVAYDDRRTSAAQPPADAAHGTVVAPRAPRKRPISLVLLVLIAIVFLVVGGVAAVVFGNIRDDDSPTPTTPTPVPTTISTRDSTADTTATTGSTPSTTRSTATTDKPTVTTRPATTTTRPAPTTTEPQATTTDPSVSSPATAPSG